MISTKFYTIILFLSILYFNSANALSAREIDKNPCSAFAKINIERTDNPAVQRLCAFLSFYNQLRPTQWEKAVHFIDKNYASSLFETFPPKGYVGFLLGSRDGSNGLDVHSFKVLSPTKAKVLVQSNFSQNFKALDGWFKLVVAVQGQAPHKIIDFKYLPIDPPKKLGYESSAKPLTESEFIHKARRKLQKLAKLGTLSGAVLVGRNGEILLAEAYGYANRAYDVLNHIETKFALASLGKMFIAVAIAQLVEKGKIALSDTLAEFIPNLPTSKAARQIQISHLLSHTSGLGSSFLEERAQYTESYFQDLDDLLKLVKGDTLRFKPGTQGSYSNDGFLLLGKIIEVVSDTTYSAYLEKHIFNKVNMDDTNIEVNMSNRVIPHLAIGYEKKYTKDGIQYIRNRTGISGSPAGGGYSTALDLFHFATALQKGILVDKKILKQFSTAKPELGAKGYGFGFEVWESGKIYGHTGGFLGVNTGFEVFRNSGFVVIVLANQSGAFIRSHVSQIMHKLISRVK